MRSDRFRLRSGPLAAVVAISVATLVVIAGLSMRSSRAAQLKDEAIARGVPTVALVSPTRLPSAGLELPARIEAWSRAPIYARVSGYLARWRVDIGSPVKAGQVLGEIETPELDQQLLQARAELATARSNVSLAASTAQRWQSLLASDSVSKQEVDERAGDLAAKQSVVNGLLANVDRVQALKRYTRLVAPFDGVVTARNTDVGALINVGGSAGSELFVVSDVRRLRVYVSVPQRQIAGVRVGAKAQLVVPERTGQTFEATVQSMARAIDSGTGAMLVQLAVDNAAGELLPGGFASVRFDAATVGAGGLSLPPGALIFGKNGVHVATVGPGDRVALKRVTVARDLGNVIELADGLSETDRVINSPPDGVANGDAVRVATAQ